MYEMQGWVAGVAYFIAAVLWVFFVRYYIRSQCDALRKSTLDKLFYKGIEDGQLQAQQEAHGVSEKDEPS